MTNIHQFSINVANYDLAKQDLVVFTSIGCDGVDLHRLSDGGFIASYDSVAEVEYEFLTK
jgi:hypothetical protein